LRPFNLTQKTRARIYQRIFRLANHQRWQEKLHCAELIRDLNERGLAINGTETLVKEKIP
ncbi:hypothetical protein KOI40_18205, partial [Aestuariicella sp. G3-2]|uniref:hypothetical protein n=1 Tax=Pseudomaricurvus albidus TaxID=2842452 RepID=UPI001C0AF3BC